jgi:hypothetical protein
MDDKEARKEAAKTIAKNLERLKPRRYKKESKLARCRHEHALEFLQKVLDIEAHGGLILPDNSDKRTSGGVFFNLFITTRFLDRPENTHRTLSWL